MFAAVPVGNFFGQLFESTRHVVCRRQRRIVGQPDIDVRPVLQVVRKKLLLQNGEFITAENEK
jgi:hypothetical protein